MKHADLTWFLVNDGLIFDSYPTYEEARRANALMFWDAGLLIDSSALSNVGLDPAREKDWTEYYA